MSYGICRVQKMTAPAVKGIEIHDLREKEGCSHTNKDIDWSRSALNYDLCPDQNRHFYGAVKRRIAELQLPRAVRKDAVVMAQVLVTSDRAFFDALSKEQTERFFRDSYAFLSARFGADNVVSSIVHLDEKTPHMHFNFVPVTADGRLSAKQLFTPASLRELQDAFIEQVGSKYGLERGKLGSDAEHLDTLEYKIKCKQAELDGLNASITASEARITALEADLRVLTAPQVHTASKTAKARLMRSDEVVLPKSAFDDLVKTASVGDAARKEMKKVYRERDRIIERAKKEAEGILAEADTVRRETFEESTRRTLAVHTLNKLQALPEGQALLKKIEEDQSKSRQQSRNKEQPR